MDYKGNYTFEEALDRVEHPQSFIDIAEHLCVEGEETYTTDVLPTTEPLKTIKVSVLYRGTKETKWIDCTYSTQILLSFPTQVYGYFSHKGDKINIKRVLKWKYR